MAWPNPAERRFWMLVFSYALPAIAPGPIITLFQIYLNRELGVAQADLRGILWMPPLAWGSGYFFWGWIADRFASNNPRPVGLFLLLTVCSLALGVAPLFASVPAAIALMSWIHVRGVGPGRDGRRLARESLCGFVLPKVVQASGLDERVCSDGRVGDRQQQNDHDVRAHGGMVAQGASRPNPIIFSHLIAILQTTVL